MASDSNASQLPYEDRIVAAIADLRSQKKPNFSGTAEKWQLERKTLSRRFKGESRSVEQYQSEVGRRLNNAQEETLIGYIERLTLRGMPPTPRIVRNLAEEIVGEQIGVNWHANFVKHHKDQLTGVYLRDIDNKRKR